MKQFKFLNEWSLERRIMFRFAIGSCLLMLFAFSAYYISFYKYETSTKKWEDKLELNLPSNHIVDNTYTWFCKSYSITVEFDEPVSSYHSISKEWTDGMPLKPLEWDDGEEWYTAVLDAKENKMTFKWWDVSDEAYGWLLGLTILLNGSFIWAIASILIILPLRAKMDIFFIRHFFLNIPLIFSLLYVAFFDVINMLILICSLIYFI